MQKCTYELDDRVHEVANPWGSEVPIRAFDDRGAVTVTQERPSNLPSGSTISHVWTSESGGRALKCSMHVDNRSSSPVLFEMWYKRE